MPRNEADFANNSIRGSDQTTSSRLTQIYIQAIDKMVRATSELLAAKTLKK